MNDPNGFSYFNGEYHLFYQHHPYSPKWGPMHWGHVKSKDLVNWEHLPIALAPSEDYDVDGCFSGSAFEKDGKMYLMYTGNKWTGPNGDTDLLQVQCLAVSEDGIHFDKLPDNPVIAKTPEGDIHPFHFRDPKVWKKDQYYYCVLGSRTNDEEGQILLYRSENLIDWEFVSVAAKGENNFSFMWECPDIFEIDGHDVLVMSPQGVKPVGDMYQNLHQAGYVVGNLDYQTGKLEHGEFEMLDYGFDFYAPQTTTDDQGRRIMMAWMAMWESEMPEQEFGWAGAMTIPRQLFLEEGKLISRPIPEMTLLREREVSHQNVELNGHLELPEVNGTQLELELTFDLKAASTVGLNLLTSEDQQEKTVLQYDRAASVFSFDREQSGAGPKGIRKAPVKDQEQLHLRIFVDHSSIEVFVNDGEKVLTGRVYPKASSKGISFFSDQPCQLSVTKWEMKKSI
ncbi:glycoside hydrolase family 32 protein [Halalkalibacter akibai]|nr:glycoside hydrolase family 32 protein [Halalkalibacter akibai]